METATLPRHQTGPEVGSSRAPLRHDGGAIAALGLTALGVGLLFAFLYWPTYPNYDSYYSLLWGRELLGGHLPSFEAYQAPTEHPLAVFYGTAIDLLGSGADRVMVFMTYGSFVALAVGLYRLGRLAFTPAVGLFACVILCSRFDFPFLAARGYIDIPYLAFVIWAAALEAATPRRGTAVLVLLALASMMRPEAWILSGLYFLWVAGPATWPQRYRFLFLTVIGPLIWVGLDFVVTGNPTFSQTHTSSLADDLGRSRPLDQVPAASAQFLKSLTKTPVYYAGILGTLFAAYFVPRRAAVPLLLAIAGELTFLLIGAAGLSVIFRYLLSASVMMMLFASVAIVGWTVLEPGRIKLGWIIASGAVVLTAAAFAVLDTNFTALADQLKYRGEAHKALVAVLRNPKVEAGLKCGVISTPSHKLIPDTRWITHRGEQGVRARSEATDLEASTVPELQAQGRRLEAQLQTGVALYVNNRRAILLQSLVDATDDPLDSVPPPGWTRVASNAYYGAYVKC